MPAAVTPPNVTPSTFSDDGYRYMPYSGPPRFAYSYPAPAPPPPPQYYSQYPSYYSFPGAPGAPPPQATRTPPQNQQQQQPQIYSTVSTPLSTPVPSGVLPAYYPVRRIQVCPGSDISTRRSSTSSTGRRGRKRSHGSESYVRTSSIAGTIYNSSAVYKRLKPSTSFSSKSASEKTLRPQGRPFSSNLTGRFLLHDNLFALLRYMNRKIRQKLACYDLRKLEALPDSKDHESEQTHSSNGRSLSSRNSASCKFEDINLGVFEAHDPIMALDDLFGVKHCSLRVLDCCGTNSTTSPGGKMTTPQQHTITYNPSSSNPATPTPRCRSLSDTISPKKEEKDIGDISHSGSHHNLKFLLNKKPDSNATDSTTVSSTSSRASSPAPSTTTSLSSSEKIKTKSTNFHRQIVDTFGVENYQFIKAIRDNNGHILKLESIKPPRNSKGEIEYSAEWVKQSICYPRYKGGMKIHFIKDNQSFVLYNDLKMLLWDIKQEATSDDPLGPENNEMPLLSKTVRDRLFGGRLVYVKTP